MEVGKKYTRGGLIKKISKNDVNKSRNRKIDRFSFTQLNKDRDPPLQISLSLPKLNSLKKYSWM